MNNKKIHTCGNGWGLGINVYDNGNAVNYGFPESENPLLFIPDMECCTEQEIINHQRAIVDWNLKKTEKTKK